MTFTRNKIFKIIGVVLIVILFSSFCLIYSFLNKEEEEIQEISIIEEVKKTEEEKNTFFVDIKGAVKKPGVYEVSDGMILNDLLKQVGLKSNAVTYNLNLSKKLTNEMVIYVFKKSELTTQSCLSTTSTSSTTTSTSSTTTLDVVTSVISKEVYTTEYIPPTTTTTLTTSKTTTTIALNIVNINQASKEELMTLNGIGESKANAIISYREKTPFEKNEDIMNVSGIGESAYAKIKDYITV